MNLPATGNVREAPEEVLLVRIMTEEYHEHVVDERLDRHSSRHQELDRRSRKFMPRPEHRDSEKATARHDAGAMPNPQQRS